MLASIPTSTPAIQLAKHHYKRICPDSLPLHDLVFLATTPIRRGILPFPGVSRVLFFHSPLLQQPITIAITICTVLRAEIITTPHLTGLVTCQGNLYQTV